MRSLTHTTAAATGVLAAALSLLTASPAAAAPPPRSAETSADIGFGWWPYALGLALITSLAIPVPPRRRGRRGGGRGARE
ncbi:hypothetical protein GCM10010234_60030 [Streptomyces hawaiiensis]